MEKVIDFAKRITPLQWALIALVLGLITGNVQITINVGGMTM